MDVFRVSPLPWTDRSGRRFCLALVSRVSTARNQAGGSITTDRLEKLQVAAKGLEAAQQKFGDLYVKVAEKVLAKGAGYVGTELERLSKLIDGGSITPDRKAAFLLKANVLKAFKGEPATDVTEEL